MITTSVCGLSFALPEIWVRFGLRLIVGAGPCASVYAASEGLSVLVLDCRSSGGQAGASARIENSLGFPTGISGMAPMARAYNQAHKFEVETTIPSEVVGFDTPDANKPGRFVLRLASGDLVSARSIPSDVGGASGFHFPRDTLNRASRMR